MSARTFLRGELVLGNEANPLFLRDPKLPPYLFLFYNPPYKGAETEESLVIGDTHNHVVLAAYAEGYPDLLALPLTINLDARAEAAGKLGRHLKAAGSISSKGTIVDYLCRDWTPMVPDETLKHNLRSAVFEVLDRRRLTPPTRHYGARTQMNT